MDKPNKMSLTPPQKTPNQKSANDFVDGAGETKLEWVAQPEAFYPWEHPSVRADVSKHVNLRLPEAYHLKLRWLAEQTNKSQQVILREILLPEIDRLVGGIVEEGVV